MSQDFYRPGFTIAFVIHSVDRSPYYTNNALKLPIEKKDGRRENGMCET
jgi:hypothetical protein